MPTEVQRALRNKVTSQTLRLEAYIKVNKLSGQVLHVRSGDLRRSIKSKFEGSGDTIRGEVVSEDVKYAGIQEYGGITAPHEITPVKAKALAFMQEGKMAFYKRVHHPGSKIPERSYMRSALAELQASMTEELRVAVIEALRKR